MDRADEKLRELFSEKLSGYNASVDPGLWAGVQSGIQSGTAVTAVTSKSIGFLPWAAAVVVGLGIAVAVWPTNPTKESAATQNAPTAASVIVTEDDQTSSNNPKNVADIKEGVESSEEKTKLDNLQPESPVFKTENGIDDGSDQTASNDSGQKGNPNLGIAQGQTGTKAENNKPSAESSKFASGNSADRVSIAAPKADFDIIPASDTPLTFRFSATELNDEVIYLWNFGDGQSHVGQSAEHTYAESGEYKVELIVSHPSSLTATEVMVLKAFPQGKLLLPNIFSPDGNGINDTYDILALSEHVDIFSVSIANMKGEVVFEYSSDRPLWDGNDRFGKQCPVGVYFVAAAGVEKSGEIIKQTGTVHLKR